MGLVPAALTTTAQALALLRRSALITLTRVGELASLCEAVAAGPIVGSWWGHPKGGVIFRIASELEDHAEVLVTKLVAGKVTFLHAALWPALYRVVSDEEWRAARIRTLDAPSRQLLERLETEGVLRPADKRTKGVLEASLLVRAVSVHTDKGSHATELSSWRRWATPEVKGAAAKLSLDDALGELRTHAKGAPLALEEKVGRARSKRPLRPQRV